jgi:hypothetical protein
MGSVCHRANAFAARQRINVGSVYKMAKSKQKAFLLAVAEAARNNRPMPAHPLPDVQRAIEEAGSVEAWIKQSPARLRQLNSCMVTVLGRTKRGKIKIPRKQRRGKWHPAVPARCFAKLRSDKIGRSTQGAVSVQTHCSGCAGLCWPHSASYSPDRPNSERGSCGGRRRLIANRTQEDDEHAALGRTWVMSGLVHTGQQHGRGNIDANDPEPVID